MKLDLDLDFGDFGTHTVTFEFTLFGRPDGLTSGRVAWDMEITAAYISRRRAPPSSDWEKIPVLPLVAAFGRDLDIETRLFQTLDDASCDLAIARHLDRRQYETD